MAFVFFTFVNFLFLSNRRSSSKCSSPPLWISSEQFKPGHCQTKRIFQNWLKRLWQKHRKSGRQLLSEFRNLSEQYPEVEWHLPKQPFWTAAPDRGWHLANKSWIRSVQRHSFQESDELRRNFARQRNFANFANGKTSPQFQPTEGTLNVKMLTRWRMLLWEICCFLRNKRLVVC